VVSFVGRVIEVNQHRVRLVLGWVIVFVLGKPSKYAISQLGQLSLPPFVGSKMSTGDGYSWKENGEFRATVDPVVMIASLLT